MVVQGVSTRKVKKITTKLCGRRFTKSTVLKLTKDLDQQVTAWAERPLEDSYPFLVVDAMHVKVRRQQAVRSSTVMLVVGISGEGYREILGLKCCYGETGSCYRELFQDLKDRGLTGVELITSDSHEGLKEAIFDAFPGVVWNRCHAHFSRNVLDRTPSDYAERMHELLDRILQACSPERAREVFSAHYQEMADQAGRALKTLKSGLEEVIAVLALPGKYRRRLRTTNMLERFIEEIRRREKVIRIFPNMDSCWRLIGALIAERHEEWSTGRKYLDMTEYWGWKTTGERNQTPAKEESKLPAVPA